MARRDWYCEDVLSGKIDIEKVWGDEISGPVMELFVADLEVARDELLAHGCEVIRWREKGQDCYIRDPSGVIFNLWERSHTE